MNFREENKYKGYSKRELRDLLTHKEEMLERERELQRKISKTLTETHEMYEGIRIKQSELTNSLYECTEIITYLLDRSEFGESYLRESSYYEPFNGSSYDINQLYQDIKTLNTVIDQSEALKRLGG